MLNPWTVYWVLRLDGVKSAIMLPAVIAGVILACIALYSLIEASSCQGLSTFQEEAEISQRRARLALRRLPWIIPFVILNAFIPTTKQMAVILVLPAIAKSEPVNALGSQLTALASEWAEELRPKNRP